MNERRRHETAKPIAAMALLSILGGLPACNAISGVDGINFATCSVTVGAATTATTVAGGNGGEHFDDACPANQVLIGLSGGVVDEGGAMSRVAGLCGTVTRSSSDPRTVTIAPGAILPSRGTVMSEVTQATCPSGQVVVGFEGGTFTDPQSPDHTFMSTISLHCAPLVIGGTAAAPTIAIGVISVITPVGAPMTEVGPALVPPANCPATMIGVAARAHAVAVVDGFGLGCAAPAIHCAPAADP